MVGVDCLDVLYKNTTIEGTNFGLSLAKLLISPLCVCLILGLLVIRAINNELKVESAMLYIYLILLYVDALLQFTYLALAIQIFRNSKYKIFLELLSSLKLLWYCTMVMLSVNRYCLLQYRYPLTYRHIKAMLIVSLLLSFSGMSLLIGRSDNVEISMLASTTLLKAAISSLLLLINCYITFRLCCITQQMDETLPLTSQNDSMTAIHVYYLLFVTFLLFILPDYLHEMINVYFVVCYYFNLVNSILEIHNVKNCETIYEILTISVFLTFAVHPFILLINKNIRRRVKRYLKRCFCLHDRTLARSHCIQNDVWVFTLNHSCQRKLKKLFHFKI